MAYPQGIPSLEISDSIFQSVMDTLKDSTLSAKERVYLSYVTGRAGRQGVVWHQQKTLAEDLGFSVYSVCRLEKKLQAKGRLKVFDHGGRTYRSPYVPQAEAFLSAQRQPAPEAKEGMVESSNAVPKLPEQECKIDLPEVQEPLAQTASDPVVIHRPPPTPEAVNPPIAEAPKRPCTRPVQELNPVQARNQQQQEYQDVTTPPVDNQTNGCQQTKSQKEKTKKNPYRKNRHLVKHLVDDLAEQLNAWQSWNYLAKIVWSICEEGEEWLYQAVSWVKEEEACGRCNSKMGLFDWKLVQDGIHPLKC